MVDGQPAWSDNQPSYARVPSRGGSLVVGGPGWREHRHGRRDEENAAERARHAAKKAES